MIRSATATLILTLASQLAQADTLSEALAAKQRGDAAAAYPLWVKLAEQGDHKAALEVGLMHHLGQGVPPGLRQGHGLVPQGHRQER